MNRTHFRFTHILYQIDKSMDKRLHPDKTFHFFNIDRQTNTSFPKSGLILQNACTPIFHLSVIIKPDLLKSNICLQINSCLFDRLFIIYIKFIIAEIWVYNKDTTS